MTTTASTSGVSPVTPSNQQQAPHFVPAVGASSTQAVPTPSRSQTPLTPHQTPSLNPTTPQQTPGTVQHVPVPQQAQAPAPQLQQVPVHGTQYMQPQFQPQYTARLPWTFPPYMATNPQMNQSFNRPTIQLAQGQMYYPQQVNVLSVYYSVDHLLEGYTYLLVGSLTSTLE